MCTTAKSEQASRCPGTDALTVIGDELADQGYEVSSPEWVGTHLLQVMNAPLALCEMTIGNDSAQWYYQPFRGHQGIAGHAVAMVTAILGPGGRVPDPALSASLPVPPCDPLLAKVSSALLGFGLQVTCSDLSGDGGSVELAVDNPARPDRGTVRITSDHAVIWDCRCASSSDSAAGLNFASIAGTIARALTAASQ